MFHESFIIHHKVLHAAPYHLQVQLYRPVLRQCETAELVKTERQLTTGLAGLASIVDLVRLHHHMMWIDACVGFVFHGLEEPVWTDIVTIVITIVMQM